MPIPRERFDVASWYDPHDNKAGKSRTARAALIDGYVAWTPNNMRQLRLFNIPICSSGLTNSTTSFSVSATARWNRWTLSKSSCFSVSTGRWRMLAFPWRTPAGPGRACFSVRLCVKVIKFFAGQMISSSSDFYCH